MTHQLAHAGYGAIALAIGLETMGVPFLPGETTLLAAAAFAGGEAGLAIGGVIGAAIAGAIIGAMAGYGIGRLFGFRLLLHHGSRIGLTERRMKLGIYLFDRYGGAVIFIARFVAVLRSISSFLAGANKMPWRPFMIYNVLSAIIWAGAYGTAAWYFGKRVKHLAGPVGGGIGVAVLLVVVCGVILLRRNEARLSEEAERAMPGPLEIDGHRHRHHRRDRRPAGTSGERA
ncbi:MAG TPA: DedA family protein [Acetobacteraceae bacterium]|nr:DedA family protein [Acetobacteraceae bacterium]